MSHKHRIRWLALFAATLSRTAVAALGGDIESISQDRVHTKAMSRTLSGSGYTVHELQTASGTTVREYASASGKVFAVSWNGPTMPDLRQVLGTHFAQYAGIRRAPVATPGDGADQAAQQSQAGQANQVRHVSHAHRGLRGNDLVVQSSGHMRAFSGKAYLPSLMPAGVTIDALR